MAKLSRVRRGDQLSANDHNEIVESVNRFNGLSVVPGNLEIINTRGGTVIASKKSSGNAGGAYFRITTASVAGGKWYYSAEEVYYASSGYDGWDALPGGRTLSGNLYNWDEVVDHTWMYQPVPDGAIVWARQFGDDWWFGDAMNPEWGQAENGTVEILDESSTTGGAATLDTDDWDMDDDDGYGVKVWFCSAPYYLTSTQTFYYYRRYLIFDAGGRLMEVGEGESRVVIDLVSCT